MDEIRKMTERRFNELWSRDGWTWNEGIEVHQDHMRSRAREEVLEELARRLLKGREAGLSLSDMQAMARDAGVEP